MGIFFSLTNNPSGRAGAAWRLIVFAVCVLLLGSCRDKDDRPGSDVLAPPLGVVFSIPSGDVSFFDLESHEVVHRVSMETWIIVACEFHPTMNWMLAVAEAQSSRVALWSLPSLAVLGSSPVGGAPMDVASDMNANILYSVTRNGAFWMATLSSGRLDTMEVRLYPRRMTMRPPGQNEAWVVCPGDCTLHVIRVREALRRDSVKFDYPPSDIAFSPDGVRAFIAFEGMDGGLREFDATTLALIQQHELGHGPYDMTMSRNGHHLAVADSSDARLFVFDFPGGERRSAVLDSGAVRVRYAESTGAWYVLSKTGGGLQVVSCSGDSLAVTDRVAIDEAISELIIWEQP